MKKGFAGILDGLEDSRRSKLEAKLPQWAERYGELVIPGSLSLEQCSSDATAAFKAGLVRAGCRLADLTGGLGADCLAFSRVCGEVLYNEMSAQLLDAAKHNFEVLGIRNVVFSGREVRSGNLDFLREFRPDVIYADPARRATDGRKVFYLTDCSPDIPQILDELYSICPDILLKLSPMADISQLGRELDGLKEVWIVGHRGECKELVCSLHEGFDGPVTIHAGEFDFTREQEASAKLQLSENPPRSGELLFEPSAVLSKAGCYGLICERYGLTQLSRDCHLFVGENFPSEGKVFRILEVFPMGREGIRAASRAFPDAEVSARGLKMNSDELRRRLRCRPSSNRHIFGVNCAGSGHLLYCEVLRPALPGL